MGDAIILILLLLLTPAGSEGEIVHLQEGISYRRVEALDDEFQVQMIVWRQLYVAEMAPVREQWSRVVEAIHQGRISDLSLVCPEFRARIDGMNRKDLGRVVDPVVRTWLGRGLDLLNEAASLCQGDRFFALGFRLYQARHVIQAIDRRVLRYR